MKLKVEDPIKKSIANAKRNKRRRDRAKQLRNAQPPSLSTNVAVPSANAQEAPVNIDNDATYELEDFDPIHREDAGDVEASEDADGFSAAEEEPEPEPGPESTLAQDVREAYVRDFAAAAESRTCFLNSSAGVLRSLAGSRPEACPRCAVRSPEGGRTCPVTIITWEQPICVDVPVCWCTPCRAFHNMRPTEFNCLPDAKAGWDLHLQRDGQHVLWWHQSLLQLFDLVSFRSRHLSADAFCSALLDTWEQNGIRRPVSVSATTLRKRLRQALLLYMDCQGVVDDYPEGTLSTWPRGALNGCPCCGDTLRCSSAVNGAAAAAPAPVTGAASPGVVGEAAAVEGPDPGLERTEVAAAGSPAATEGNPVPPVPSAGAAAPETMAAAVSTGAEVLGAAVLASTDWLLRDTCSPEAAGPGPTSLHSVHFDACFKLNLLSHKGYVSGYTQLGRRRYFLPNASIQQVLLDGHASQQIGVTHCSNFDADKVGVGREPMRVFRKLAFMEMAFRNVKQPYQCRHTGKPHPELMP
ncbi:hypothetical protein VOLCADRAFT_97300 [Volvox carteri f. nagariensis]|uniref:Uncharacterized protein n=1 Tax=Volvox carteri f. nagariensis TaxID=3068 RepID=D8UCE6_VOLCA|nr:uncharacterized protein VOLCADRAFT_97300 [Volvox carteri f. nagariensis]EFJ42684.1 hypothetical protein VOLCADRAFT_97300 [Volvox carteri f. nagariensis]|eukprot:XP_002956335.1 hypothetical protein VOLCADRAFT_97300 [Volvox carteri f. nagariensis]